MERIDLIWEDGVYGVKVVSVRINSDFACFTTRFSAFLCITYEPPSLLRVVLRRGTGWCFLDFKVFCF